MITKYVRNLKVSDKCRTTVSHSYDAYIVPITIKWIGEVLTDSFLIDYGLGLFEASGSRIVEMI